MQKISNRTEMAVIFKKVQREIGTVFVACDVVMGKLDRKNMTFTDQNGKSYYHIFGNNQEYGFALRSKIGTINQYYKKKTFSGLRGAYLKDLKLDFYYYTSTNKETYHDLKFISEDSKYHTTVSIYDRDLEIVAFNKVQNQSEQKETATNSIPTKELIQEVKSKIIGQDNAIEELVSVLWQNSKTDYKSNALLVGPTGVGKTEMIRVIAQRLKIPMVIVDTTNLTASGYKGNTVEDILTRLVLSCNGNVTQAEQGIIVLDEIDKLSKRENFDDFVATVGVQYELLKVLEDGVYSLNIGTYFAPKIVEIHTKNIMVIGTGAFSEMKKVKSSNKKSIGFLENKSEHSSYAESLTVDDFINYGFIPEFMGRFSNIITLSSLSKEDFIEILKSPSTNSLKTKLQILTQEGIKVEIAENVYEKIATKALEKNTGARGLGSVIDSLFIHAMVEISQNDGVFEKLIIDENTVQNSKKYQLIKKRT